MLRQLQRRITVATTGQGFVDLTDDVSGIVAASGMSEGLITLFCRHTSASLLIQENADPDVRVDLARFFAMIAPEHRGYVHDVEGSDDMPAHIRAALTQTHLSIPVSGGRLMLGTWQGIYLFEHRRAPHQRSIVMHLIGD